MKEEILKVKEEIQKHIEESKTLQKLEEIRVNYMGKKGIFTDLSKKMKDLTAEERPKIGQIINEVKEKITNENNSITSTTDITNLRVVDLTLEKEGKKYSTNANRTVRIALLNNEKGNEILVYHVKDNGELEELTKEKNNLTITNDSVEFTINHFSKFAIASIKKNIPTPSTNTSEEHNKNKDKDNRKNLTDIKPSESNQNKILPRTGVSSSSTVLLGATLLSLALISRKLKKN